MILVDANLLVYARVASLPQHADAKRWLDERLNGTASVGLPWPSLLGFLRLVSNPRIFSKPESIASAWQQAGAWLDCPCVWVPAPTERHREVIGRLLTAGATRANLIPDAHLAALAIEHGLTLCSTDGDFARFPGLKWENPLR
jgi:toxin-antitoxin system PIN domain toxin